MHAKPYVGVTGPVTVGEVESLVGEFSRAGYSMGSTHLPMVGFLVSYQTLNGQAINNRRYPPIGELRALVSQTSGRAFPMVHYSSREKATLADQVSQVFDGLYEEGLCRAVQFNITWPDVRQIELVKERFPEMQVVFAASGRVMSNGSPQEVVKRIGEYEKLLDYVLLDPSGGQGKDFNVQTSLAFYEELRTCVPSITAGFAGGFTGENVGKIVCEIRDVIGRSDFCIDAEGGLRDKITSAFGDDIFNVKKVSHYLQEASKVLP